MLMAQATTTEVGMRSGRFHEDTKFNVYDGKGFHIMTLVPVEMVSLMVGVPETQIIEWVNQYGAFRTEVPVPLTIRPLR